MTFNESFMAKLASEGAVGDTLPDRQLNYLRSLPEVPNDAALPDGAIRAFGSILAFYEWGLSESGFVPETRFFTNFDGTSEYLTIPAYTGNITMDVYPLEDNTGLPTGTPALDAFIFTTITVPVTALTEIGRNGANYFRGIIANISGDGLDVPVALDGGVESPASLVGTPEQFSATQNIFLDWIDDTNLWTSGDFVTTASSTAGTRIRQADVFEIGYEYLVDGTHSEYNNYIGNNRRTLEFGVQFGGVDISYSENYGGWDREPTEYYNTAGNATNQLDLNISLRNANQAGTVSDIQARRAFKVPRPAEDINVILTTGQSLSVGQSLHPQPDSESYVKDGLQYRQLHQTQLTFRGTFTASERTGYKRQKEGTYQHSFHTAMMATIEQLNPNNDIYLTMPSGNSNTPLDGLLMGSDSWDTSVAMMDGLDLTVKPSDTQTMVGLNLVHGESGAGTGTYTDNLNTLLTQYQAEAATHGDASNFRLVMDQCTTGGYYPTASEQWDISKARADTFMSGPKYWINWHYHETSNLGTKSDLHLSPLGYDIQGEYLGKVWANLLYGAGDWKPLQLVSAVGSGTEITLTFDVPVPPLVIDTTLLPQAVGDGITYEGDFVTITPTLVSQTATSITIDVGETVVNGRKIYIGRELVEGDSAETWPLPMTNIRDSDPHIGIFSGLTLHNWCVVGEIAVTV